MIKKFLLLIIFLNICSLVYAQINPIVEYTEEDAVPSTYPYKVITTNGSITDNNDGTINLKTVGTTTTTTKFCIDTDEDTCWYKTDADTAVMTINDYVAIKMLFAEQDFFLLLDDGVGEYKLLLDDGSGGYFLIIE